MKKLLSVIIALAIAGGGAYITTQTDVGETIKSEVIAFFSGSDEEQINKRIDDFITAYNTGDMDGVLNCMNARTKNANKAAMNMGGDLLKSFSGIGVDMSDMFAMGIAAGDISIDVQNRKISFESDTQASVSANFIESNHSEDITIIMVKENNKWFIKDIK